MGEGPIPVTCPIVYSATGDGLCCGRDSMSAVSADYAGGEYPFTGTIRRVVVDLAPAEHATPAPPKRD